MAESAPPSGELLRLLPKVLRARDFHLYLEGGKRLVDLWLAGGKAALGHKPPRVLGELKNAGERGLFVPLPHPAERRLLKALEGFFPGRGARLYREEGTLYRALEEAGFLQPGGSIPDPAFPRGLAAEGPGAAGAGAKVSLWRPFLDPPSGPGNLFFKKAGGGEKALALVPALPWPLGPAALLVDASVEASFPPGDLIPPALLAPAIRALYDLAAALKAPAPNRGPYPQVEKALKGGFTAQGAGGARGGNLGCRWRRKGIYLAGEPALNEGEYRALFVNFLEGGFLIPPSPAEPLILPASMSRGEESKLAELLSL